MLKGGPLRKKGGSSVNTTRSRKEYFEDEVAFRSGSEELKGIVTRPARTGTRNDFIIFLHGFAGNKDENGLFTDAARRFASRGYGSLRFDFHGHGESTGKSLELTIDREIEDFKSAMDFIREQYRPGSIYALGFSLGAYIALRAPEPAINGFILWSPALRPSLDMYPRYSTGPIGQELKTKGWIDKSGLMIGSGIIEELKSCDIEPWLSEIHQPMLIIHGTRDSRISYSTSEHFCVANSRHLDIRFSKIANAGHSYKEKKEYREQVFSKTIGWLSSRFSGPA